MHSLCTGAGEGLSFQELPNFSLVTTTATLLQEPEKGNHYSSPYSLLKGKLDDHENGMAPLALDECGFPIDFSPLDWTEGGNMVLWNSTKGKETKHLHAAYRRAQYLTSVKNTHAICLLWLHRWSVPLGSSLLSGYCGA